MKGKGKLQLERGSPHLNLGSQIQHLMICPELLKICSCGPELKGGGWSEEFSFTYNFMTLLIFASSVEYKAASLKLYITYLS